jgi:hypothetical protein
VIGADLSPSMLWAAKKRVHELFVAVAADGQALPFSDNSFDAVICPLGLQFFLTRRKGSANFGVSFVPAGGRPYASPPRRTGRRCGVCWPMS